MVRNLLALAFVAAFSFGLSSGASAKLPPPTEEQKTKAAEVKAKADEAAKKDAEALAKAQDKVASRYIGEQAKLGKTVTPTPIVAPAPTPVVAAPPTPPPALTAQEKAPNNAQTATPHNAETGNAGKDKPASKTDKPMQTEKPTGSAAPAK